MKPGMTKKSRSEWVKWSYEQLQERRVDPFLQGWRCASALIMAFDGIPQPLRRQIMTALGYAEGKLWKKTRKMR